MEVSPISRIHCLSIDEYYLVSMLSCFIFVLLCDLLVVACQVPLPMQFFRQEYWSWLPCLPPGGSSQSRDRILISYTSCIDRLVFTTSATRGALNSIQILIQINKTQEAFSEEIAKDDSFTRYRKFIPQNSLRN